MARIGECSACQMGNHKHHRRVVQAPSDGIIGGVICDCKGECSRRGPSKEIMKIVNLFRRVGKRNG